MITYIPPRLFNDINNEPKVRKILSSVPESCLVTEEGNNIQKAIQLIKDLGEERVADSITVG